MIKFFRSVRQRLLSENKFSKYLIYAIGEIILVFIGIAMALQFNNWNDTKNSTNETKQFTKRLLNEFESNLAITKSEIANEQNQIQGVKEILSMINKDKMTLKSRTLDSLIYIALSTNVIDINLGTLTEGLNTGKIALIKSDTLRTALYNFPTILNEVKVFERLEGEDVNDHFMPHLYNHYKFRDMDNVFSRYNKDIEPSKFSEHYNLDILNTVKFESLVDNRFYNSNLQLEFYEKLRNELQRIQELIKKELMND